MFSGEYDNMNFNNEPTEISFQSFKDANFYQ